MVPRWVFGAVAAGGLVAGCALATGVQGVHASGRTDGPHLRGPAALPRRSGAEQPRDPVADPAGVRTSRSEGAGIRPRRPSSQARSRPRPRRHPRQRRSRPRPRRRPRATADRVGPVAEKRQKARTRRRKTLVPGMVVTAATLGTTGLAFAWSFKTAPASTGTATPAASVVASELSRERSGIAQLHESIESSLSQIDALHHGQSVPGPPAAAVGSSLAVATPGSVTSTPGGSSVAVSAVSSGSTAPGSHGAAPATATATAPPAAATSTSSVASSSPAPAAAPPSQPVAAPSPAPAPTPTTTPATQPAPTPTPTTVPPPVTSTSGASPAK